MENNSLDCREGHMKKNSLCVCLCQGQRSEKHFLCLSVFALDLEETWSWVETKVQKNIDFFRVQRSKKHFLRLSVFALDLEQTWFGLRRKCKKTIDFFRVQMSKMHYIHPNITPKKCGRIRLKNPENSVNRLICIQS